MERDILYFIKIIEIFIMSSFKLYEIFLLNYKIDINLEFFLLFF